MKKQIILAAVFGVVLFGFGLADFAQASEIPGVDVIVRKKPGGSAIMVKTGIDGSYNFTGLPAGNYDLTIPGQPVKSVTVGADGEISGVVVQGDLTVEADETFSIAKVGTLPTSRWYFVKELGRGIMRIFTFGSINKAELELKITNEKAAELLAVEKTNPCNVEALTQSNTVEGKTTTSPNCKPRVEALKLKNALENYTSAQERLQARLAKIKETSENPKVEKLLEKLNEQTLKHADLLNQLAGRSKTTEAKVTLSISINDPKDNDCDGRADDLIACVVKVAQEKISDTILAGAEKDKNIEQKATEQIKRAGEVVLELESVAAKQKKWLPANFRVAGGETGPDIEPVGSMLLPALMSVQEKAKEHLTRAIAAFAEGKFGEAFGQARSAEVLARNGLHIFFEVGERPTQEAAPVPPSTGGEIVPEVPQKVSPVTDTKTACTRDAKICPDGSAVGRTGPNCEFAACPTETTKPTIERPAEGMMCTQQYDPVCGVDGKTHSNECMAKSAGIAVKYKGECAAPSTIESGAGTAPSVR